MSVCDAGWGACGIDVQVCRKSCALCNSDQLSFAQAKCKHLPDSKIQLCHDQIVGADQSLHVVQLLHAALPELAVAPCICLHIRLVILVLQHLLTSCVCF